MSEVQDHGVITEAFKEAMRELATTVSVITTANEREQSGLTATAVCSLAMEPASILVCVNRSASALPLIIESGQFCVNLLASGQEEVANVFAGRSGCAAHERFAEAGDWTGSESGAPMLDNAMANIACELSQVVESGTHSICIGLVKQVRLSAGSPPLIYSRQGYDTLLSRSLTENSSRD
ncbi:MAG: flavin reductase family protein [Endozoicomonas sp.]